MKYLLDTNICIYLIKQKPPKLLAHFQTLALSDIGISWGYTGQQQCTRVFTHRQSISRKLGGISQN